MRGPAEEFSYPMAVDFTHNKVRHPVGAFFDRVVDAFDLKPYDFESQTGTLLHGARRNRKVTAELIIWEKVETACHEGPPILVRVTTPKKGLYVCNYGIMKKLEKEQYELSLSIESTKLPLLEHPTRKLELSETERVVAREFYRTARRFLQPSRLDGQTPYLASRIYHSLDLAIDETTLNGLTSKLVERYIPNPIKHPEASLR